MSQCRNVPEKERSKISHVKGWLGFHDWIEMKNTWKKGRVEAQAKCLNVVENTGNI